MDNTIIRGALNGAGIGGIAGGVASWLITLADTGIQPLVYLTCGVYAGIACGGIIGAVTAGRRQAQVEYAFGRRP
jgi:hypothetical protein